MGLIRKILQENAIVAPGEAGQSLSSTTQKTDRIKTEFVIQSRTNTVKEERRKFRVHAPAHPILTTPFGHSDWCPVVSPRYCYFSECSFAGSSQRPDIPATGLSHTQTLGQSCYCSGLPRTDSRRYVLPMNAHPNRG